jgi:hypothetical protein
MMTVQVAGVRFPGRTKDLYALEQMEARGFDGPFLKIIESASRACAFPEFSIGFVQRTGLGLHVHQSRMAADPRVGTVHWSR